MTKILVTGGAGFIGAHLTQRLIKQKHKVMVVDSLKTIGGIPYINPKSIFVKGDIRSKRIIKKRSVLGVSRAQTRLKIHRASYFFNFHDYIMFFYHFVFSNRTSVQDFHYLDTYLIINIARSNNFFTHTIEIQSRILHFIMLSEANRYHYRIRSSEK